jgi:ClpP class serine protease
VSFISAGKYKTEANPYEPLSSDARDAMQTKVNEYYGQFTAAVARGRGTTKAQVEAGFGEGRMVMAKDAVKQGMADRVATFDQTMSRLGARSKIKMLPGEFNREAAALREAAELEAGLDQPVSISETASSGTITVSIPDPAVLDDLARRRKELDLY